MSQTPPQLEGQIDAPNPMELFWEKNKVLINAVLVAAVLAIIVNYGLRYLDQQKTNAQWSGVAVTSGMDGAYADGGSQKSLLSMIQSNPQMGATILGMYYGSAKSELVSVLPQAVRDASQSELDAFLVGDAKGTPAEPVTRWFLAQRAIETQDWDVATAHLDRLEKGFPEHFLCRKSAYPIQWRDEVETDENSEKGEEATDKKAKPALISAHSGSALSSARARIAKEKTFRAANPGFYAVPEVDFGKVAVFDFGAMGKVKIGFYADRAPLHRDAFLRLAEEGFWAGQRVHQVTRQSEGQFGERPEEVSFGLVSSKEDSISSWKNDEDLADEANAISWETSSLSHFPFMLAAEPHIEGKSQIQRLVVNANDAAATRDGTRVIFGRIIEGVDVIEEILGTELSTESEETAGQGRPVDFITIESVTVITR